MPTPSEQKALAFLASVLLLGGAVRVVRAGSPTMPSLSEQQALARQADAADSASRSKHASKGRKGAKMSRKRRDGVADTVAGVVGVPFQDVRPDRRDGWINGFPPPSPRIDIDNRLSAPTTGRTVRQLGQGSATPPPLVDLDRASAPEIDALPRVGPALAARIVANRDSFGAFGSLEAVGRVRGVGPGTLRNLGAHVTFSGRPASPSRGSHAH